MSDVTRRDILQRIALSITAGPLTLEAAQHVHGIAADEKAAHGVYKAKALNAHEYKTLEKLADFIVPPEGATGGATAAGAPEWIDLMASQNPQLLAIYTGGIAWLDHAMQRRGAANFVDATPEQQIAMLDLIAYRKNESPELGPGIKFFEWARKMVVDAYYTSAIGIKDIGYMGNTALSKFEVPQEAIDYALKRSPV
ncbi:MAG TPA: gluconate 2-dehydrogenase subunit 3 family protein [Bryobacteraceae bacterium]|nr:gluconate 2-dehydrogenase subunit 3 family protein [Bryobacteraceae bacterium]